MKKRYIAAAILALEIASLPAAAHMVDKVVFSVPQKAIHVKVTDRPGITKFVVSSNAPFAITSQNAIGEFIVKLYKSGEINGKRFGDNAQLPGDSDACAFTASADSTQLYHSKDKTAAQKGSILSQAVVVEIHFDPSLTPELSVLTEKEAQGITQAHICDATNA